MPGTVISISVACTLRSAHQLMDHHFRIGQGESFAFRSYAKITAAPEAYHADADSGDIRLDVLYRVIHRQSGSDRTAGGIDIQINIFLGSSCWRNNN